MFKLYDLKNNGNTLIKPAVKYSVQNPLFNIYIERICGSMATIIFHVFCYVWWLCMAIINISVQYNGGLLPDIILLTRGYYPRGTHLNTM